MQLIDMDSKIVEYANKIKYALNGFNPIYKLFDINNMRYIYDTGTNKIAKCSEAEYSILKYFQVEGIDSAISDSLKTFEKEVVFSSLDSIYSAVINENLLKSKIMGFNPNIYEQFGYSISHKLSQIILDITEKCNFRCSYCVYNSNNVTRRNHGNNEMSLECARSSIDYLREHGDMSDKNFITFYGGEPLLRFSFIKSLVEYAKCVLPKEKIHFGITTNGTLINDEVAKYFYDNNFSLTISIDGPKKINDSQRYYKNGNSAYKEIRNGLETTFNIFGNEAKNRIFFSMVYAPPYSEKKLNEILSLWEEMPFLPIDLNIKIAYADVINNNSFEDKNLVQWAL
jgi:uncharacterized protein